MTKRSLKGTKVTTLAGLLRSFVASIWDEDATPDSTKDNPVNMSLIKDLIDDAIFRIMNGVFHLAAPTTDFIALDDTTALTKVGAVYTVNRSFYAIINGTIYKINTGSDTEVDTMTLELSATEDGMYKTLDLADGASGSAIVDVTDIVWLKDIVTIDGANTQLRVKTIVDEDDTGPVDAIKGLKISGAGKLNLGVPTELTIRNGAITVTRSFHIVDTQNNASSDDLNTINGGADGDLLFLIQAHTNRDVTIKHNAGNIKINQARDVNIGTTSRMAIGIYSNATRQWIFEHRN